MLSWKSFDPFVRHFRDYFSQITNLFVNHHLAITCVSNPQMGNVASFFIKIFQVLSKGPRKAQLEQGLVPTNFVSKIRDIIRFQFPSEDPL